MSKEQTNEKKNIGKIIFIAGIILVAIGAGIIGMAIKDQQIANELEESISICKEQGQYLSVYQASDEKFYVECVGTLPDVTLHTRWE